MYRPRDIMQYIQENYDFNISYTKAWRSIEDILVMV